MKYLNFYREVLNCKNESEIFNYLISNLKPALLIWTYFVNWDKVFENTKKIELSLNILNYLIGKEDFDEAFRELVKKNPQVIETIPALVVRNGMNTNKLKILIDYKNKKLIYDDYDFSKKSLNDEDIEKYLIFAKSTGIKDLIANRKIKNLVDYIIGVEAGLDSNARKNRGGTIMEDIVELFIKDVCLKKNYRYIKQANAEKIKKEFGYIVPVDKSSRRYDFVIDNKTEPILIETNFYGGGGSKLKSTAGEYRNLFDVLKGKYKFFWITDGKGWNSTSKPLSESFNHNDYLFTLSMLEKGILENIL